MNEEGFFCEECGSKEGDGVCITCNGSGEVQYTSSYTGTCHFCKGSGICYKCDKSDVWYEWQFIGLEHECQSCDGDGKVCSSCGSDGKVKCSSCSGSGTCYTCREETSRQDTPAVNPQRSSQDGRNCTTCGGDGFCTRCESSVGTCPNQECILGKITCNSCYGTGDCEMCYGMGTNSITDARCSSCWGSGSCKSCSGIGEFTCSTCEGLGYCTKCMGTSLCPTCNGSGKW